MLGYVHKDSETGCLIPVTTAGPTGGTVEKLEYGCNKNYALPLTENTAGEGYVGISCECPIYYNPVSGTLTVDNITGNITNADIAECVCVTDAADNTSYNVSLICNNEIYKSANNNLTFNPASGELHSKAICVFNSTCFTRITPTCTRTTCICANTGCITHVCSTDVTATSVSTTCVRFGYCGMLRPYGNGYQPEWGNQTGTTIAGWDDCTGGNVYFRRDNPTVGQLSMILDGTVYVDEGRYAVVHDGNIGSKTAGAARQVNNTVSAGNAADLISANMGDNDLFRIRVGGDSNDGYVELATADDGTEPIYVRQYTGVFQNVARTATLLDGHGNTEFPGTVCTKDGLCTNKGDHDVGTVVAGLCMASSTNGYGYYGGSYIGHYNPNYDGYWGYATFGFYNAENDTLCRGICVNRDGCLFGSTSYSRVYTGNCYIPTADSIRWYLNSQGGVKASLSGCTLYLCSSSWS